MKRLLAIVDAGDAGVTGVLAGEALRRAARDALSLWSPTDDRPASG